MSLFDRLSSCRERRVLAGPGYRSDAQHYMSSTINQVLSYLQQNLPGMLRETDVAAFAGMSVSTFTRFFRRHTGSSFVRYLNRLRINEACELLMFSDLTVTDICYRVGFNNLSNFNRQFLAMKQVPPSRFRALHRLNEPHGRDDAPPPRRTPPRPRQDASHVTFSASISARPRSRYSSPIPVRPRSRPARPRCRSAARIRTGRNRAAGVVARDARRNRGGARRASGRLRRAARHRALGADARRDADRSRDQVLRPAILWNDTRAGTECVGFEALVPESRAITGNMAMPGFTAPKLLWLAKYGFRRVPRGAHVLLPKDYLIWRLSGEFVSEMSDASGTLWLDCARRDWSDRMLAATELTRAQMPRLVEGNAPAAQLRDTLRREWGIAGP